MTTSGTLKGLLATPQPPELGPGPRAGVQSPDALGRASDEFFEGAKLRPEKQAAIRALVLLWHDQIESAHEIAQGIENADGAFIHGIVHRREPDYSNAKYWFHRVGRHGAFSDIALSVNKTLDTRAGTELRSELVPNGAWDAFAFIDACARAARRPAPDVEYRLLRDIQRVEMETLLHFLLT